MGADLGRALVRELTTRSHDALMLLLGPAQS